MDQIRALITGLGGQDGTYLAHELVAHRRKVIGFSLSAAHPLPLVETRVVPYDEAALIAALNEIRPREIYHLASPSCIRDTAQFESDIFRLSLSVTTILLRWIAEISPATRFFFAGSSEIYGDPWESPQSETTRFSPQNPYAVAKLAGQQMCGYYRRKGVFACAGILFNHESPLRRSDFVSRRITRGVAEIACGRANRLALGNLEALRDWSHVADFTQAFRLILESPVPRDYVLASGVSRSVQDFCQEAFQTVGLDYREFVVHEPGAYRPDFLLPRRGNPEKARCELGWNPAIDFREMVREMVRYDLALLKGEEPPPLRPAPIDHRH